MFLFCVLGLLTSSCGLVFLLVSLALGLPSPSALSMPGRTSLLAFSVARCEVQAEMQAGRHSPSLTPTPLGLRRGWGGSPAQLREKEFHFQTFSEGGRRVQGEENIYKQESRRVALPFFQLLFFPLF